MNKLRLLLALVLAATLLAGAALPAAVTASGKAYVEPALAHSDAGQSVIVTAASSQAAARAVGRVGGLVTSDLWLIDAVAATIPAGQVEALAAQPGVRTVTANKGVTVAPGPSPAADGVTAASLPPRRLDGPPDVEPTNNPKRYRIAYPVIADVGADTLQQSSKKLGRDVTIALVDSGIYFSPETVSTLGGHLNRQFLGQADFVETQLPKGKGGTQYADYCFISDKMLSRDRYGHGTHVAGIIWNNLIDENTGLMLGVAPEANIISVRVLGDDGTGSYETVIKGLQWVVANKDTYGIRILNLSLSAQATVPYFADPLNRAVEQAWALGIVVLAAAGNSGPAAETITVPGNDPYVITVGAVDGGRTAGCWADDLLPSWSACGPTRDGFAKPDVLAPGSQVVSFMHNSRKDPAETQVLAQLHPGYSATAHLFRMSGTSMSTAVASGVVALMLQAHPELTPNQVKHRLMATARSAVTDANEAVYNTLQQGAGRIWAPDAVLNAPEGSANAGMDIAADLAHGCGSDEELAHHYQGPIRQAVDAGGERVLYYCAGPDGSIYGLGAARAGDRTWLDRNALGDPTGQTWLAIDQNPLP
ncbi:MAG TPA: S8 family peptidase, partial [Anaerolineae bacterium]|nr:S8 family peptidase [Anaerolineae bacterium]